MQLSLQTRVFVQAFNDSYRFVLYDSGLVIVRRTTPERFIIEYFAVQLSLEERAALMEGVDFNGLLELNDEYMLASGTDAQWDSIDAFDARTKSLHMTEVFGLNDGKPVPPAFARAYRVLDTFASPREKPWFPDYVYLSVSRGKSVAVPETCAWPSDWGTLPADAHRTTDANETLGTFRTKGEHLTAIQRLLVACHHVILSGGEPVYLRLSVYLPHQRPPG